MLLLAQLQPLLMMLPKRNVRSYRGNILLKCAVIVQKICWKHPIIDLNLQQSSLKFAVIVT